SALTRRTHQGRDRKWRLFNCACCRGLGSGLLVHPLPEALAVSEQYADGLVSPAELTRAAGAVEEAYHAVTSLASHHATSAVWGAVEAEPAEAAFEVAETVMHSLQDTINPAATHQPRMSKAASERWVADLLRDIFGNAFHPVGLNPAWSTSTVGALAQAI